MGTRITKFRRDKYDIQGQNFEEGTKPLSTNTMTSAEDDDVIEQILCDVNELKDNEMKEFTVGDGKKILLVKENGQFSALGNKCTHYGAPLINGVLCNGFVRCPWHGACFNSQTGDIEDFPGLDSIPKFEVNVENKNVKIRAKKSDLQESKRQKEMAKRDIQNSSTYVIIGAGGAGAKCVETLRQAGFQGRIVMITKESHLPYDRPKMGKALDMKPEQIALRNITFYESCGIEILKNKEVTSLNTDENLLTFTDGSTLSYSKLLLAMGGIPRRLENLPGAQLENIFVLRSADDANTISEAVKQKNVIIYGMSFIGMESAAYFVGKAASVSVVGRTKFPFLPTLGDELGARFQKLYESKGVTFYCDDEITEFRGHDGKLTEVCLKSGCNLPADVCVLGIGVLPLTKILSNSGIKLSSEGYVLVDENLKSSIDNVYAAGDIAKFPMFLRDNEHVNVQHWQIAHYHGHIAGLNMADVSTKVHTVPFFWTSFFGLSMRYAGLGTGYDDIIIKGNLENLEFLAYYLREGQVIGLATMKKDPVAAQFAELLRKGKILTKEDIASDAHWEELMYS